ncbi:SRT-29 protein [Aphelenchoides avenae]|nr:SRT-29 protein [Aphelenchus avenae]
MYILCMLSIRNHLSNPCYKFMFYIGIADVMQLWVNGLICGYFAMVGAVYCSYPTLAYVSGCFGLGCWVAESTGAVFLAFSRCLEVWSPRTAKSLMQGNRAWLWLIGPTVLSVYMWMFTQPVIYNGKFYSVFFNPHMGYIDEITPIEYHNTLHEIHNTFLIVSLVGVYLVFCVLLLVKLATSGRKTVADSFKHKLVRKELDV